MTFEDKDYDPEDDFSTSLNEGYRAIRERVANGGQGWETRPSYLDFIERKSQLGSRAGFEPLWMPDFLFDFQRSLVDWSLRKGRAAIFADCGLGKGPMQLVWADNVVRKTNQRVLILAPIAVAAQLLMEANKFGIEAHRSFKGELSTGINITNYERIHFFDPNDFIGTVCEESSCLKNFDGTR